MESYHGTSSADAGVLAQGTVDVTRGGGELGMGFYTGEFLHEAKAWAYHVSQGDRQSNVVVFKTGDDDVECLDLRLLGYADAASSRNRIRQTGTTRSYQFGTDMVWAPIVGSNRVSGDQYKWESDQSEALLNGARTGRSVI